MLMLVLAAVTATADVLISAGHEGRPASCAYYPKRRCNLGAAGERALTPRVADQAARVLRADGFSVIRKPADFDGTFAVKDAVFIHFDGNTSRCASGSSIGYHREQDKPAAVAWRSLYTQYWKFRFQPDNFTDNLSNYYGFRQVDASDAALVLEMGELTCPKQYSWLEPRIDLLGGLIARFVEARIKR